MSFKFPFSTYHELNLDWILKKVETLSVNAEADANTIASYEERLQTAETQAQNAETSAANAQTAATSAASVAENALTTANSAQSSADASGALASQAATKADAAQSAAESARQAAETAQATAANFDGRITSAEQQASEALNMAQRFDEQARAAITTANNAANVATEAQATANATALELARQRTALETLGSQQTAAINSAGASQVTAINNAGQAVLDSLPADYMNGVELVKDYTLGLYPQIEMDYASILSFDNGADNIPVKDLNVNIIPNQSGTGDPSPSNIRPISGWTGVNIYTKGQNLLPPQNIAGTSSGVTISSNGDIITLKGTPTAYGQLVSDNTFTLKAGTYFLMPFIVSGNGNAAYQLRSLDGNTIYATTQTGTGVSFTLETNVELRARITYNSGTTFTNLGVQAMVVSGNIPPSEFAPYKISQITVSFPSEAGTVYGGFLTLNPDCTGTLLVDKVIKNSGFSRLGTDSSGRLYRIGEVTNGMYNEIQSPYIEKVTCSALPVTFLEEARFSDSPCITYFARERDSQSIYVGGYIGKESELDTLINSGDLSLVYPLATPITYSLTSSEISGILNTFYGYNNVWADVGNTSITYRADLGLFITENCIANYTKFAGMIAGVETGLTASQTYSAGDYFIVGQKLYKALTNIANGATFTLGTNCEETTVGAELVLAQ